MTRITLALAAATVAIGLAACSLIPADKIAAACDAFRRAEANPRVQLALAGGTIAANIASSGTAGPVIASLRAYGDRFCAEGPPAGDTTTTAERAAWLANVTAGLLSAAR